MNIEGKLAIGIKRQNGLTQAVNIESSRPLQAVKLFKGKSVSQLLELIPMLYSVCGTAQAYCACTAAEQALSDDGSTTPSRVKPIRQARLFLVNLETIREHLWRILLDWPVLLAQISDSQNNTKNNTQPSETQTSKSSDTTYQATDHQNLARLNQMLPLVKQALFVDGKAFGLDSQLNDPQQFVPLISQQIDQIQSILSVQIFSISPQNWIETYRETPLHQWYEDNPSIAAQLIRRVVKQGWERCGNHSMKIMPDLALSELNQQFLTAAKTGDMGSFIAHPHWHQEIFETTPFQRQSQHPIIAGYLPQYGNGLLLRLLARLVELAELAQQLRVDLNALNHPYQGDETLNQRDEAQTRRISGEERIDGVGFAWVEAARGRLFHRLELSTEQKTVKDFRILAPTEWNFHPDGVAATGLAQIKADSDLLYRQQAELWLNSIDPCVSYDLDVQDLG